MLAALFCFTACDEAEEASEYDNWQVRNQQYVDSIATLAKNVSCMSITRPAGIGGGAIRVCIPTRPRLHLIWLTGRRCHTSSTFSRCRGWPAVSISRNIFWKPIAELDMSNRR